MNAKNSSEEGEGERECIECDENDVLVGVSVSLWGVCFSAYSYQILQHLLVYWFITVPFFLQCLIAIIFLECLIALILLLSMATVYREWLHGKIPPQPERRRRNNDHVPWYARTIDGDDCCIDSAALIIRMAAQAGKLPYPLFRFGQIFWCVAPAVIAHIFPGYFLEVIFLFHGIFIINGLDYFHGFYTLLLLHLGSFVATIYVSVSPHILISIAFLSLVIILLCGLVAYRQPAQAIVDHKPAARDSAV